MSQNILEGASNELLAMFLPDEDLAKGLRHQADTLDILFHGLEEKLAFPYSDLIQTTMREAAKRLTEKG